MLREHWWPAVATLTRLTGDLEVAEDAVQDACTAAVGQWPADGWPASPGAWLTGVARHKALDRFRREARRAELEATAAREAAARGAPPPPALVADDELGLIDGGGMALGLFPAAEPASQEVDLRPGDLLFMFTDGVSEARRPEMTYFEERLADRLSSLAGRPPTEVCSAMQALVLEFSMNDLRDDMTMLVLRVGRPPAA